MRLWSGPGAVSAAFRSADLIVTAVTVLAKTLQSDAYSRRWEPKMYPIEFDAAILKANTVAAPTVFTVVCGIENVSVVDTVNTTDKFRHDCAKPGAISTRSVRVNSTQWNVTGSGVTNAENIASVGALMGAHAGYQIDVIQYDGTDTGKLLGTFAGQAVMTSRTFNVQRQADSAFDVALSGENSLVWTPAP